MADNMIFSGVDSAPINPVMDRVYVSPLDEIREGSEDVHVKKYVAYGKTSDHKLYVDSAMTIQVAQADAEYAFKRGMLIIKEGANFSMPVSMAAKKVVTIAASSGSVTAVEWTVE